MKFQNTRRAFVPTGARESVPPYGVTRDYTDDEIAKSADIRHAVDRGYLIKYDPNYDPATAVPVNKPKVSYQISENEGGARKTQKSASGKGKAVEYVVADAQGADGVSNPDENDVIARDATGKLPLDYIETGLSGRDDKGNMKTAWQTASESFEKQLQDEAVETEYDDSDTLTEGDNGSHAADPLDAEHEIQADLTTMITKAQGNMGATETNAKEMVKETMGKTLHELDKATRPNYDEGERIAVLGVDPKFGEVADLLAQPFSTKKWFISKSSDKEILATIVKTTQSENVKALASQRLTELKA